VPDNVTLIALPPKCPEPNPVDNIWQFLRDNWGPIGFLPHTKDLNRAADNMTIKTDPAEDLKSARNQARGHFFRFHLPHAHLHSLYGDDWFALKAEKFARFFGTPTFLVGQTIIVGTWILINIAGWTQFDVYPFILLNLAFSLQAAYAAPLILLAQTRQADRDKAHAEADALHREDLARVNDERQSLMAQQTNMLLELVTQNTQLTETIKTLTERVEVLTTEVHKQVTVSTVSSLAAQHSS
jgi:uncharacterized membrane protein